ncbi:hypothetical protein CLV72_11217 [Allonocardiopsis opalescens]|uniref:Uncharacterized protein n=2 Tax=Allonocardiopsis opalescens TaxID=1144618 RepID=A0A2T0PSR6_9ACTN|nr:hypothetical protein CLV72_11217 [Allonocardiopsis opalescens]
MSRKPTAAAVSRYLRENGFRRPQNDRDLLYHFRVEQGGDVVVVRVGPRVPEFKRERLEAVLRERYEVRPWRTALLGFEVLSRKG